MLFSKHEVLIIHVYICQLLDLLVAPFIRVCHQIIKVQIGGTAILECDIEAFPEPLTWWEKDDGRMLETTSKYRMEIYEKRDMYKVILVIIILYLKI